MKRRFLLGVAGGFLAVGAVGGVVTYLLAGTESTTPLDRFDSKTVNGHRVLDAAVVEGRVQGKYHPQTRVGRKVSGLHCPAGLKAVAGATLTCTGKKSGGGTVDIPVSVVKADATSVTWKFER